MSNNIKFGTDGWRAIIADDFTVANVMRVAYGTAKWLHSMSDEPSLALGHDCRFGGKLFVETTARVVASMGVKVVMANNIFVSTPMISLAANKLQTTAGVILTASHNPPSYNGYKIKANFGGPATPDMINMVESLIPNEVNLQLESLSHYEASGMISYIDMEEMYLKEVYASFDIALLRNSPMRLAYDAMYGAGQRIIPTVIPNAALLHCSYNPSFMGTAPEPIMKNLGEFSEMMRNNQDLQLGLATDGDADRIGLMDENGNFVDSHHIILLLINYLHKHKGLNGKVVVSFSCSNKIKKLCELYGLPIEVTKIGFKYICEIMTKEDVLVGAEESGGIAVKGFIPERDGIWNGLVLLEYMAKTGKNINELIAEIYALVGSFWFDRLDLHVTEAQKTSVMEALKAGKVNQIGTKPVIFTETTDGYKLHLSDNQWVMFRASGTEPVLRVYAEAENKQETAALHKAVREQFGI